MLFARSIARCAWPRRSANRLFARIAAACAIPLAGAGCQVGVARTDINSADAGQRILAIRAAAERSDRAAIPLLVDRLNDEDEAVRMFAILALERITGTRLGYDYRLREPSLSLAVERWRTYVREGGALARSPSSAILSAGEPDSAKPESHVIEDR